MFLAQSAEAVEFTDCISAEGRDFPNECPAYDTKKSDSEAPGMLELRGMPSFSSPLWPRVVAPNWILSIGQIELNRVLIFQTIQFSITVFNI